MSRETFSRDAIRRNEAGQTLRNCSPHRTICEVLREINDMHQGDTQVDIDTRAKVRESVDMAKRMDRKLKEYNKEYDADWWEANKDYEADLERRLATDYIAMDDEEISDVVRAIPSMGGREIGRYLREWAASIPDGREIIELGVWLGAGTAQMALGVKRSGANVIVHGYDRFRAGSSQVVKARIQGINLEQGQDTEPVVTGMMKAAGLLDYVAFTIGEIGDRPYLGWPIGMYVDDACKREQHFIRALRTFGPKWVAGETIVVLMDYWYFERKPGVRGLRFQHDWMSDHAGCFEVLNERMPGVSAAAFRYLGGEPWEE